LCRLAEAEHQYQVVLDLCSEGSGDRDAISLATARRDLGRVLALQRRFDRAEEHYTVAVDMCARLLGYGTLLAGLATVVRVAAVMLPCTLSHTQSSAVC
jgi:hypothetical protein